MKLKNISNFFSQSRQQCVSRLRRRIGNPVMNEGNIVPWSDLPSHILCCVASRLGLVDQIRFRAVCKSWSKIKELKPNDELPWIFMLNNYPKPRRPRSPHYYLYDLHHQKLYGVYVHKWITRMRLLGLKSRYIICIKFGRLLVNPFFSNSFFLFNPFTQKFINLPTLPRDLVRFVSILSTFWYCPKSRRFIVYATNPNVIRGVIIIKRWKNGDRRWESINFAAESGSFMNKIIKIEVVGEALYCVFETGGVGCFNERHKSWSVVVKYSEDDYLFSTINNSFYTFEFRGKLLMMNFNPYRKCHLWRLDQSKGRWVEVVQFHKCVIFCSYLNDFSFLCSEQYGVASDPVASRIYYFKYPSSGVSSKDYNDHLYRISQDFDPFHIMNIKFPWCHGKNPSINFSFYWIEPYPFFTNKYTN